MKIVAIEEHALPVIPNTFGKPFLALTMVPRLSFRPSLTSGLPIWESSAWLS